MSGRFTASNDTQRISYLEQELERVKQQIKEQDITLKARFVQGRLRTDRSVPSGNADIQTSDKEGDIVRSGSFEYIIVNTGSALKWARITVSTAW